MDNEEKSWKFGLIDWKFTVPASAVAGFIVSISVITAPGDGATAKMSHHRDVV